MNEIIKNQISEVEELKELVRILLEKKGNTWLSTDERLLYIFNEETKVLGKFDMIEPGRIENAVHNSNIYLASYF